MKFEVTAQEQNFAAIMSGLTSFVMNTFEEYEQKLRILADEIKKLQDEKKKEEECCEGKECVKDVN